MTKVEPLKHKRSFSSVFLNNDGSFVSKIGAKGKKSTLTITRDGIDLAVIVGVVDIESVELEGNTVLRIKD